MACLLLSALAACGDDEDKEKPASQALAEPSSAVCVGEAHTCVMKASGEVYCTGMNLDGQLGDGTTVERHGFVPVVGISDARSLSCGAQHSCVVRTSGKASCWGQNHHAELGSGSAEPTQVPVEVQGLTDIAQIAAGNGFTCARKTSGAVSCWGMGKSGRLGNGGLLDAATPSAVVGLSDAIAIAAGEENACAIREGGAVVCWGEGSSAQLGRGDDPSDATEPVAVSGVAGAVALAVGGSHSCAATSADGVYCWGGNGNGELGDEQGGPGKRSGAATRVVGLSGATALALGPVSSCALHTSGDVSCWGHNGGAAQRLGVGSEESMVPTPTTVAGVRQVTSFDVSRSHGCGLTSEGAVWCWGSVYGGQLGAYEGDALTPVTVLEDLSKLSPEASAIVSLEGGAAGTPARGLVAGDRHFCGVEPSGQVRCFGDAAEGQLGAGSTARADGSVIVPGIRDAVAVAAGIDRACALRAGGEVACWGRLGQSLTSSLPVPVEGLDDAKAIAVGGDARGILACAIHEDGGLSCWSRLRRRGGASVDAAPGDKPTRVAGLSGPVVEVAVGLSSICARTEAGDVQCWGDGNFGQLGDGAARSSATPVAVKGLTKVTEIAANLNGFCAVHARGAVSCWGDNRRGELGTGSVGGRGEAPRAIRGLAGVERLALGGGTACAIAKGAVRCWGANELGQGGGGSAEPRDVTKPRAVASVEGVGAYIDYACGTGVCCGLHEAGEVSCAGSGSFFGSGVTDQATPKVVEGVRL